MMNKLFILFKKIFTEKKRKKNLWQTIYEQIIMIKYILYPKIIFWQKNPEYGRHWISFVVTKIAPEKLAEKVVFVYLKKVISKHKNWKMGRYNLFTKNLNAFFLEMSFA